MTYPIRFFQKDNSMNMGKYFLFATLLSSCLVLLVYTNVRAASDDNIEYQCRRPEPIRVECDYRLLAPDTVTVVNANLSGNPPLPLPPPKHIPYPRPDSVTAILFVIDTSTPAKLPLKIEHLRLLAAMKKSHHSFGLAVLHNGFKIIEPLGTVAQTIFRAANHLDKVEIPAGSAPGLMPAIQDLGGFQADRKAVFFFSDGNVTQPSYYQTDLINAAQENKVAIFSIAYPPNGKGTSAQHEALRRLSAETGGGFAIASEQNTDTYELLGKLMTGLDNGGRLIVDLAATIPAGVTGIRSLILTLELMSTKTVEIATPLDFNPTPVNPASPTANPPPATPAVPAKTPKKLTADNWASFPTAVIVYLLAFITACSVLFWWLLRNRSPTTERSTKPVAKQVHDTTAILILQTPTATRFAVPFPRCRIGRGKENDVVLDDSTVSRQHADIIRNYNGTYTIYDHESMNGVFVNNQRVQSSTINGGDRIDIGNVPLLFTLERDQEKAGETSPHPDKVEGIIEVPHVLH